MNIAIYGAGSMGTILGAYITKKGFDIDLISRNKSHIKGLKEKGAQITGTAVMNVPVNALLPGEIAKKYDIILLMTKTTDNTKAVKTCASHLTDDGIICTLQNGLPELSIAEVIGEDHTYGCATAWGASKIGEGVCELTSSPDSVTFSLGSFSKNPDTHKLNTIKSILESMGHVDIEDNFIGARWSKLLINSAFSGISSLLGCTFGEAAKNKSSRYCIHQICKECIDVAKKADIVIEPVQGKDISKILDYKTKFKKFISFQIIPIAIKKHASLRASMLQDLEKGKHTEVDEINGIVSKYGKKYDHPTPYNDLVVKIIHEIEEANAKPSFENLNHFNKLR